MKRTKVCKLNIKQIVTNTFSEYKVKKTAVVLAKKSSDGLLYSAGIKNYIYKPFEMAVKYPLTKYTISGGNSGE